MQDVVLYAMLHAALNAVLYIYIGSAGLVQDVILHAGCYARCHARCRAGYRGCMVALCHLDTVHATRRAGYWARCQAMALATYGSAHYATYPDTRLAAWV